MRRVIMLLCLLYLPFAHAAYLGEFGRTFAIAEVDFLSFLEQKIKSLEERGEWQKLQTAFKKRVKEKIERPDALHLSRTEEARSWDFDPTFKAPASIKDYEGKVIIEKGTEVNPLSHVSLSSTLLFLDGDDPKQLQWAKEELQKPQRFKLVLVSGSIKEATNYFREAVYFDLNGFLIKKFHIEHLPATICQEKLHLKISEVRV